MRLTGAQIVIKTLAGLGVDTVFGYPGGWIIDVYDALYRSRRIRHILTCHEQAAAHAADGYARRSGKLGVVMATSGPGGTNLVTGLAAAYMDSVPVLAITCGVPPAIFGKDNFQEIDLYGVTMPVTKHNFLVKSIEDIEPTLVKACAIALSGRPGPVAVDIHADLGARTEFHGLKCTLHPQPVASEEDILRAAELIASAKRPSVIAGGGTALDGAEKELSEFAGRIGAAVCVTSRGLGCYAPGRPEYCGLLGMHGTVAAAAAVRESDLVVAVGMRFSDRTVGRKTGFAPDSKIIHIDIDEAEIDKMIHADVGLTGGARRTLARLTAVCPQTAHPDWIRHLCGVRAENPPVMEGGGVSPKDILTAMQAAIPGATVVTDVGQHQIWKWQYCTFESPRQLLTSCGLGAMGFGMGAAEGAQIAAPGSRVVLVAGDGSFHMDMAELATMVTEKLPVVILILDNRALGMVRQWQRMFYRGRYSQTVTARKTDYVKLAKAMGASGVRLDLGGDLRAQFSAAARLAETRKRPVVVDARISPDWAVLPMRRQGGEDSELITTMNIRGVKK